LLYIYIYIYIYPSLTKCITKRDTDKLLPIKWYTYT